MTVSTLPVNNKLTLLLVSYEHKNSDHHELDIAHTVDVNIKLAGEKIDSSYDSEHHLVHTQRNRVGQFLKLY